MSRLGRRIGPAVGLVVAALLLSGCGNLNPGVAVKAGDETISMDEVDTLTEDFCTVLGPQVLQAQTEPQTLPLGYLRGAIAGVLAQRSVAEQLAAEYDVGPGDLYEKRVADVRQNVRSYDEGVQDAVVMVQSTGTFVEGVQAAVGAKLLAEEGVTDAKYSQQVKRGAQAFDEWVDENGVTFDPQFGMELVKGAPRPLDTSVSFAVGEAATQGAAEQPDQLYAKSLPSTHTCS
jgi:hypothetical protein